MEHCTSHFNTFSCLTTLPLASWSTKLLHIKAVAALSTELLQPSHWWHLFLLVATPTTCTCIGQSKTLTILNLLLVKSLFHEGVTSALHPYICKDISLELNYTWHVLQTAMFELSLTPLYTINKSTFLLYLHKAICCVHCNFFLKNSAIRL